MGFNDSVNLLLTNYLSCRQQTTTINGIVSDQAKMSCGVPQGSTLGPLLFIFYINDLSEYITNVNVKLYTDDTVFYINAADINTAISTMNIAAAKISKWCSFNKLTINALKSKCMLFSNKTVKVHNELKSSISISIQNVELETVCEYRYHGIILNERLTFVSHINYIVSIISNRLFTLKKIRQ